MKNSKFKKIVEDFKCEKCGKEITGNGYTDHCTNCLYSKHVDINPGDRKSDCKGMMKPIAVEVRNDKYRIHYKCEKCGYKHRIDSAKNDNFESILSLVGNSF